MRSGDLGPEYRRAASTDLESAPLDVLIVGGGVVGTGAALDAATRGLRTAVVEARDWASGTSSRSSKLLHGGLRYLEQLEFGLVREALRERSLVLTTLAPHLARTVPFVYPLRHRGWERVYVGAGTLLYDTMGGRRGVPSHRHLSRRATLRAAPGLRDEALVGAVSYHDGQVDDARYAVALARTAARHGALCLSRTRVERLLHEHDRVIGAEVHDLESGTRHEVRARTVISATGVWTDELDGRAGGPARVRASKGVHLLVPRERIESSAGIITRTERSVLFVIPWGRHWIVGTTDTTWTLGAGDPSVTARDVDYLLDQANSVLKDPLTRDDVVGAYAGLRPLLHGPGDDPSKLSREHAVDRPRPGLVVVAGGKLTTYRVMARDAVDAAVAGRPGLPASCTHRVPLVGADGYAAVRNRAPGLAQGFGLTRDRVEHLLRRHGALVPELLEMIRQRPDLGQPLAGAEDYLRVEVLHAATAEGALHVEDVLARRTHASIETPDGAVAAAPMVAELMGEALGWSPARTADEVAAYVRLARAEHEARSGPEETLLDQTWAGAAAGSRPF